MSVPHPTDSRFKDLTGRRFGRLLVVEYAGKHGKWREHRWLCRCDCGLDATVARSNLLQGKSTSCGCLSREIASKRQLRHGMTHSPTYRTWSGIVQRCTNPDEARYGDYGGRGVRICDRWLRFENFLADMGVRPGGRSIDRIDNNGHYEPGNCRWATRVEQANNKRNNRLLTHAGKTLTVAQWAAELGMSSMLIIDRLRRGWSVEKALNTSKLRQGSKGRIRR